jgi:hypothetical protein
VPIDIAAGPFPAYYSGYDLKTIMYDVEKMRESTLKYARDFDTDSMPHAGAFNGRIYDIMGSKVYRWPGDGLADDARMIQFFEDEYMKADEYDAFLDNPTDYIIRYYLPRAYKVFEPLAKLGPMEDFRGVAMQLVSAAGNPDFRTMFDALCRAHEENEIWAKVAGECTRVCREIGYPAGHSSMVLAPFDTVADMLRGTYGSVMDIYRQPDKLLEMVEKILPMTLKSAIMMADKGDSPKVAIPMHKGDEMFMSEKQFETFYWPTYRKLLMGLVEEGLVPSPIIDGTYKNKRLEYIKDLPRTAVVWTFEKTDMALAKKVLGGHTCITGNVTGSLMCKGTPEAVEKYCRWLIDTCAPGGGYILSMGASIDTAPPENLHAMIRAGKEYGRY